MSSQVRTAGGWSATTPQGIQWRVAVIWRQVAGGNTPLEREYVTADMLGLPAFSRGRPVDSVSIGNIVVGQAEFTLRNADGRYSQLNDLSPLNVPGEHSYIGDGRYVAIDIKDADPASPTYDHITRLWTGVTSEFSYDASEPLNPTVTVACRGSLSFYGDQEVRIVATSPITTQTLAQYILSAPQFMQSKYLANLTRTSAWARSLSRYEAEGTGLAVLGDIEVREAGGRIEERKNGFIHLPAEGVPSVVSAVFKDSETAYAGAPNFHALRVEEVNPEVMVYSCFPYSVATSLDRPFAPDVAAGGVVIHTVNFDTADSPADVTALLDVNERQSGTYEFEPEGDFIGVTFQPEKTRISFRMFPPSDWAIRKDGTYDEVTFTLDWAVQGSWEIVNGAPLVLRSSRGIFREVTVEVVPGNDNSISWDIQRSGRIFGGTSDSVLITSIQFYGIRNAQPPDTTDINYCPERPSTVEQYGLKMFPYAVKFQTETEAETWVGIMAARYTEERLRIILQVVPTTASQTHELASLDLGDRVQLELQEPSGLFSGSTPTRYGIISRVDCSEHEGRIATFQFDILDEAFYKDSPIPIAGIVDLSSGAFDDLNPS